MDPEECTEEQEMELEALESIFEEDFAVLNPGPPASFKIHLTPHSSDDGETNHVGIWLEVSYVPGYPEEAPEIKIVNSKGLGQIQVAHLLSIAEASIAENLGMSLVFTVTEDLKEWLVENNEPQLDLHQQMMLRRGGGAGGDGEGGEGGGEENGESAELSSKDADFMRLRDKLKDEAEAAAEKRRTQKLCSAEMFTKWLVDWNIDRDSQLAHARETAAQSREDADPDFSKRDALTGKYIFQQLALERSGLGDLIDEEALLAEDGALPAGSEAPAPGTSGWYDSDVFAADIALPDDLE